MKQIKLVGRLHLYLAYLDGYQTDMIIATDIDVDKLDAFEDFETESTREMFNKLHSMQKRYGGFLDNFSYRTSFDSREFAPDISIKSKIPIEFELKDMKYGAIVKEIVEA